MNKLYTSSLFLLLCYTTYSQVAQEAISIKQINGTNQEWTDVISKQSVSAHTFFQEYGAQLGLSENSVMEFVREEREPGGWSHYRYQQFHHAIKVLGAEYILHEKEKLVTLTNGRIEPNIEVNPYPTIDAAKAIEIAIRQDQSQKYIWESEPDHYPTPELVIVDKAYPQRSGELHLAYVVELFSVSPIQKMKYFIDAHSGEIILSFNALMSCFDAGGSATTLYHGVRDIETKEVNGEYLLHDNTRGDGIITQSSTGKEYTDSDNSWELASFTQKVGALDLHFSAQSTYDFYKNAFNRDGIDGKNGKILCKIIDTTTYVNAFWEISTNSSNFGIGDNIDTGPLTSLDVVGHEMTHGLTDYTCDLEYLYEAGALNEALSDIVGKTIDYKYDPANFSWLLGSRFFFKPDTAFRSMSDPNRFKNPSYYKGRYWVSGSGDNGGVHTNSGVLNYWFYMLVTGKAGTNEKNVVYDVKPLGFDTTIQIVYQMMKNYLTSTSYYYDAREASLHVAENLYGRCSEVYRNIAEAWRAVGVGNGVSEGDLLLSNYKIHQVACKEGLFPAEVRLVNQSCDQVIPKDTEVNLTISVPGKNKINEKYIFDSDLQPGSSVIYKFNSPARIDKTATLITIEAIMINDADTSNNRFAISITKNNNSDHDLRVTQVNISGSPCEGKNLTAQIRASFTGCSTIPAGTELDLILKYDNEVINTKLKTITTLYPNGDYRSPNFPIDRSFAGYKRIQASLNYAKDTVPANNTASFNAVYINNAALGYLEPFDSHEFDSTLLAMRIDSFQHVAIQDGITNSTAMVFSGGAIFDSTNRFLPVNGSQFPNFFNSNSKFTSTIYLCIDTKDLTQAFLSFDYMQKIGNTFYDSLLLVPHFAAGTRVVFRNDRGQSIGTPTYLENASREPIMLFHEQPIPLTGGPVSIEITNLSLEGALDNTGTAIDTSKDFVLMDNIKIYAISVGTEDELANQLSIYPNPFTESFNIIARDLSADTKYKMYNALGSEILHGVISSDVLEIKAGQLPVGNYVLKTYSASGKVRSYSLVKI